MLHKDDAKMLMQGTTVWNWVDIEPNCEIIFVDDKMIIEDSDIEDVIEREA